MARGASRSSRRAPEYAQEGLDGARHHLWRGARVSAVLRVDRRPDQPVRRGLLAAGLHASPAAAQTFAGLSAQARFGVIFRLGGVKRAETRQRKIDGCIETLARGDSPL
ncbi:YdeI/OmpD-associated family protein [Chryseoglobus sp. 28M-23]|uniref:YdeI/OmpD-associated family protein n=1 Tax=Chryseoglobus sp. 28M-23 TaxID=2772253 RepID=UPI001CD0F6B0|nr:YdeI/OmpD-associated family protein [Chryseoglobus sp. 28M-23]